jgi:MOSC domain-containing protein YiiM
MSGKVIQVNIKSKTANEVGLPKKKVLTAYFSKKNVGEDHNNYRMTLSRERIDNRPVLIYPIELINQLNSEGWAVKPGDLGENITTKDIIYDKLIPGSKYQLGEKVVIEITEVCKPCSNLSVLSYVGEEKVNEFIKTLVGRRGMFAKVLQEGEVHMGDEIKEIS